MGVSRIADERGQPIASVGTAGSKRTKMPTFGASHHEAIEAVGKVVSYMHLSRHLRPQRITTTQASLMSTAPRLTTIHSPPSLVEQDGKLKIANFKGLSDPKMRNNAHGWATNVLAKRTT